MAAATPAESGPYHLWRNARIATLDPALAGLGLVERGAIAVLDGRIAYAGPQSDLPQEMVENLVTVANCEGRLVTPGLIDCHTHLVWAGNRAREFELRLAGATDEEIAHQGGGILSSVAALRATSEADLFRQTLPRLDELIAEGVTTIEVKSGYGLDLDHERKSLRVARQLAAARPVSVRATFLAAHDMPPEANGDADAYIDLVAHDMLPALAAEDLIDAIDVFQDGPTFSPDHARAILNAARSHNLPVKLHADQASDTGGASLAAEYGALAAAHLEYASEDGVRSMGRAGTVAVLLPGANYFLRETRKPPVDAFRRHQVPIAIATDANPGTSPLTSLLLAMNMAATVFGLTVEECVAGVTRNAARALGLISETGSLEAGKWADFAIWNVEQPAELVYRLGSNPLHRRVWRGR